MVSDKEPLDSSDESALVSDIRLEMGRFIRQNFSSPEPQPFPLDWMGDVERAAFAQIAENILGESKADHWLQNKVFRDFGKDWTDFDSPIPADKPKDELNQVKFDLLAERFLHRYVSFITETATKFATSKKFGNDVDRVHDGVMAGLAYALNAPRGDNMDQRMNFFARFPNSMLFASLQQYSGSHAIAMQIFIRLRSALDRHKFAFKKVEELTDEEKEKGYRAAIIYHVKDLRPVKDELLAALSEVAEDSAPGANDGLLSHLTRIVESGSCPDLESFVRYHIHKRIKRERTEEGNRKKQEVSIYNVNKDGKAEYNSEVSTTEEYSDDGMHVTSVTNRHAYARSETSEEKRQKAEKAKEITSDNFDATIRLVDEISKATRKEAVDTCMAKIRSGTPANDSDILGFLIVEALHYYFAAAQQQINSLIEPQNEALRSRIENKGYRLAYKAGRSVIAFDQKGRRDLGAVVDLQGLQRYLAPYLDSKRSICAAYFRGLTNEQIVSDIGCDARLVEDTVLQLRLVQQSAANQKRAVWAEHEAGVAAPDIVNKLKLPLAVVNEALAAYIPAKQLAESKGDGDKPLGRRYDSFFDDLDASKIKNGFSWRWGRILSLLYAPIQNDSVNEEIIEQEAERLQNALKNEKLNTDRREEYNRLLVLYKSGKRYDFLDELALGIRKVRLRRRIRRVYMERHEGALQDLVSLLAAHAYIREGSIPAKIYPADAKHLAKSELSLYQQFKSVADKTKFQPGGAWGHNICRQTGESTTRMYYDIFYGGLRRENSNHKVVRERAAFIIRVRRAKANKNGRESIDESGIEQPQA